MKRLLLLTLALSCLLPLASAQDGHKSKPAKHEHDETELGNVMDKMNKAWRKLRRQAADVTQNAASLELLTTIKAAAEKSLSYQPDLAKDIPADKRAQFIESYQAKMKEVVVAFDQLEALLKANDNPAAVELIAKISALQKEGHKEYRRPE